MDSRENGMILERMKWEELETMNVENVFKRFYSKWGRKVAIAERGTWGV